MAKQNVALVAGSTGIVGESLVNLLSKKDTPGGPWKVYGLARRPRPTWLSPEDLYIQCDLLKRDETIAALSPLTDVTHLFWVTWVARSSEEETCTENGKMFQNALDALVPNAKNLHHISLQTGGAHYVSHSNINSKDKLESPFTEDSERPAGPNFYYTLEDILFETVEKMKGKLTWTVHRPGPILGLAYGNLMNLVGTLAVYGAICKHEKLPFAFPGTQLAWESVQTLSNAELVAEQEVWAATDSRGQNEVFNTVNGDMVKWKHLWRILAEKLGVEFVPYKGEGAPLVETMKDEGSVWDKIVQENGLHPSKVEEVAQWWFGDLCLNLSDFIISANKSKEHGFLAFRNTEKTFLTYIDQMRDRNLVPV